MKMENPVISREYIRKNYIHKDKVRKLVNYLEKEMEEDEVDEFGIHSIGWATLDYMADLIREKLLEETEDENNNTFTMQKQEEQPTDSNKQ